MLLPGIICRLKLKLNSDIQLIDHPSHGIYANTMFCLRPIGQYFVLKLARRILILNYHKKSHCK